MSDNDTLTIDLQEVMKGCTNGQIFRTNLLSFLANHTPENRFRILDAIALELYAISYAEFAQIAWIEGGKYADSPTEKGRILYHIGLTYNELGKFDKALNLFNEAHIILSGSDETETLIAIEFGYYVAYRHQENTKKALTHVARARTLAETINSSSDIALCHLAMGNIYFDLLQYSTAEEKYNQAYHIACNENLFMVQANTLMNLGNIRRNQHHYKSALYYYTKAAKEYEKREELDELHTLYINQAILYAKLHQFKQAESLLGQAILFFTDKGDNYTVATCHNNLGRLLNDQGLFSKALEHYNIVFSLAKEDSNLTPLLPICLLNKANTHLYLKENDIALVFYKEGLKVCEIHNLKYQMASFLTGMAYIASEQSKIGKAIEFFGKSLKLCMEYNDSEEIIANYNGLAQVYEETGQIEEAMDYNNMALQIACKADLHRLEASILINQASLRMNLNDLAEAQTELKKALTIINTYSDPDLLAKCLGNMALLHENADEFALAIRYHKQAYALKMEMGHKASVAYTFGSMARSYCELGQIKQSQKYYTMALALFWKTNHTKQYHLTAVNYGEFLFENGQAPNKAISLTEEALIYFQQSGVVEGIIATAGNLGNMLFDTAPKRAVSLYKLSLTTLEETLQLIDTPTYHMGYVTDAGLIYERLIKILIGEQKLTDAFWYLEKIKSRTFRKIMGARTPISTKLRITHPELLQNENRLTVQFQHVNQTASVGAAPQEKMALRTQINNLYQNIAIIDPTYAALKTGNTLPFETIRLLL